MEYEVRRHFRFTGLVQGVGFRSSAKFIARSLGLSGWVKNNGDGSVELEAQGDEGKIAMLVKELKNYWSYNIDNIECHTLPANPLEHSFRISF